MFYKNKSFGTVVILLLAALFYPYNGNAQEEFITDTLPVIEVPADSLKVVESSLESDSLALLQLGISPDSILNVDSLPDTRRRRRAAPENVEEKPRKLDTYVFTDSTLKAQRVFAWNANTYFNQIALVKIDTLISENRTELPFYKKDVGVTYLGPTGSATMLHNYFYRANNSFMPFLEPYYEYMNTPDNVVYYNTKTPYSDLGYTTSGNKRVSEENLKVLFTTNVSPEWNFGILYHRWGAKGLYQNQNTKDKSFTAFTSYTGKRYVAHGGYIYNGINVFENGGIIDDYYLVDTVIDAGAIDVKLKTARNKLRSNTYFLTHTYGVPIEILNKRRDSTLVNDGRTMVYFGHAFEYSRYNRVYTDTYQDTLTGYYDHFYLSRTASYDSVFASQLNNKAFIRLQPWSSNFWISNIDAGIGYRFENYYVFNPAQYLQGKSNDKYSTAYVYGGASGVFKKYFQWDAFLKYHLTGYWQNDLYFDVTARASIYPLPQGIHLQGRFIFDNKQPAYFTNNYYGNHIKWSNDYDKTQETKIQLTLSAPDWDLEAGFNNALVNKPIYYDTLSLPQQSADVINVTSVYLQKNIKLGLFHFDHRLLMQLTSNSDVIPLPMFSGNAAYYIEADWVRNVLRAQVGVDVYYNTKFYDYAYNPAAGMFHTQNEKKLGNYPWFDFFANFKWKRANIYVKLTNVAEGIIGERDYFSALHYPRNRRMLRIGIRWHFFT